MTINDKRARVPFSRIDRYKDVFIGDLVESIGGDFWLVAHGHIVNIDTGEVRPTPGENLLLAGRKVKATVTLTE